jgi:branched-chain amino acid transport system permease protein
MSAAKAVRATYAPLLLGAAILAIYLVITATGSAFYRDEMVRMFLTLMAVLALQMFSGNSGILSFGHVAFMAIGAYSSALLTIPTALKKALLPTMPHYLSSWIFPAQLSPLLGMLAGAAIAMLFSIVFALPIVRLAGVGATIATLAVLIVVSVSIQQTPSVTAGTNTMVGVPQTTTNSMALVTVLLVLACAWAFKNSRHGLRLRASRDDEQAAKALGIWVPYERFIAFTLSAFVFGLAGALYAHYFIAFSYLDFYFPLTFLVIAMLIVGGTQSVTGAVVGCVFLTVINVALGQAETNGVAGLGVPAGTANLVLAIALLLALILRPAGITGGSELGRPSAGPAKRTHAP